MPSLDDWLRRQARQNQTSGASRTFVSAEAIGVRGLLVHALSEEAKAFYIGLGLEISPLDIMTLMMTMADLQASLIA